MGNNKSKEKWMTQPKKTVLLYKPTNLFDLPSNQDHRPVDIDHYEELYYSKQDPLGDRELFRLLEPRADGNYEIIEFYCLQDLFCSERFSRTAFKTIIKEHLRSAMATGRLGVVKIVFTYCLGSALTDKEAEAMIMSCPSQFAQYVDGKEITKSIMSDLLDEGKRTLVIKLLDVRKSIEESKLGNQLPKELLGIFLAMLFGPRTIKT
ncbi:hypothetical protein RFI_17915 [Reticulomyxa filosa]|uniref:CRAL-TRIO domain-containing protein n=1 Tax=Reticulomyxa filosa TaxID=46433 RepID=X6MZ38_RETFI|nr:hypothetical protein RFI_39919 [Reticulomyxa filosa]ETO19310.1 hypothetical protein RFI_17915 [Reticulomyxa filosa]|eukprot:ETN97608.1 hypothetical protein RFI_39919 [Reticulomyxa filosa]